jgi:serine/threonine protein kinase
MTAKDHLLGMQLKHGWSVREAVVKAAGESGGNFSAGYIVEQPSGQRGFLKAIDFSVARNAADPARALQILTEAFNVERDILEVSKRFSCVVTAIADGTTTVQFNGSAEIVQYLILELAEHSLRRMAVASKRLPMPIALRALHNCALGMRQLHGAQIAHQDLKPSNVLKFEGEQFKICDVGRASIKGRAAPHDGLNIAGDNSYAPPELLYGQVDPEFNVRRFGCDAYLLGSLAAFLVSGVHMTALIMSEVDAAVRPGLWHGTYSALLPQIRSAFSRAIDRLDAEIPQTAPFRAELLLCIRQLCDPNPQLRGHPATRNIQNGGGNEFDLERYISIFDRLSFAASIHDRKARAP